MLLNYEIYEAGTTIPYKCHIHTLKFTNIYMCVFLCLNENNILQYNLWDCGGEREKEGGTFLYGNVCTSNKYNMH